MTYVDAHGERRCTAGTDIYPADCERHQEHYWCEACGGYFGVPHDVRGCHTMQIILRQTPPGATRPWPDQCACRYCRTWSRLGHRAADAIRLEHLTPEPLRTPVTKENPDAGQPELQDRPRRRRRYLRTKRSRFAR